MKIWVVMVWWCFGVSWDVVGVYDSEEQARDCVTGLGGLGGIGEYSGEGSTIKEYKLNKINLEVLKRLNTRIQTASGCDSE